MKMFNKIRMQSEFNTAMLFDGQFGAMSGTPAVWTPDKVEDGACVLIKDPLVHVLYDGNYGVQYGNWDVPAGTGPILKDLNANQITAYKATDEGILGFVDYVGVNGETVQGNLWKIGDKIAGIGVPAGAHTRVRIPQIGDEFYLGDENFASAPTVGQYATVPADGTTTLAPAATKPAGFAVKILDQRQMIQGSVNEGIMYRVRVIQK